MQTASLFIRRYRRRRILFCLAVALITLPGAFSQRFIAQRNLNQQQIDAFTLHSVEKIDKILSPLAQSQSALTQLVGQPCEEVTSTLRYQAAVLQTLRSISLVKDGVIYCSSVLGARSVLLRQLQPRLATKPSLILSLDHTFLKGSPILIQWYPTSSDGADGVLLGINTHLLGSLLLEPQKPLINEVIFSVAGKNYINAKGIDNNLDLAANERLITRHSERFPFSISVKTPGATALALSWLPTQTPLVVILTLLIVAIAWVVSADRMSFSYEFSRGIAGREFGIYCQPQIDPYTRRCTGVEILLRWQNPRLGNVAPDVFIPVAENHNLIAPLTRYVIAETVRNIERFPDQTDFHISINAAASHFMNGMLLNDVNQLWFSHAPRQQLVLELTERDSIHGLDAQLVRDLRSRGALLAIDDFGTGNSALHWLEQLHPDILKIDKSFVSAVGTDAVNSTVTDMIIALGQRLNIELVAEGVETPQQADYLCRRGVQKLQGFLYSPPIPIAEFPHWLAQNSSAPGS